MNKFQEVQGSILTPQGWVRGRISFRERIEHIHGDVRTEPHPDDDLILPGFMDLHVHGGGGADIMDGDGAIDRVTRMHARHGTTSLLATTMTAPRAELEHALVDIGRAVRQRGQGSARVLGVHLEGPYINQGRLGAQPAFARSGTIEELSAFHELAPIRVLTLAPELSGHLDFIRALRTAGIIPQIGHSQGSYEDGVAALEAGAAGFTHLFNAMTELHHRKPGMVGAALAHAQYAELIPDLLHVHPGAIRAALRAIPKLYCVTDSMAGAGMPDGVYSLGSHQVTKCLGGARLPDGTLAGSVLTTERALANLVSIGLDVADATRRLSTYPADYLGIRDRGRLAPDCWADLVVMRADLGLKSVFVEGEAIEINDV